jgi:hypothetical protein
LQHLRPKKGAWWPGISNFSPMDGAASDDQFEVSRDRRLEEAICVITAEPASVLLSKNDARSHRGTIYLIPVGAIGLNSIYHFIR